jgi:hypothetical protein
LRAYIQNVIDKADLVFAVWNDPGARDGVGVLLIKGTFPPGLNSQDDGRNERARRSRRCERTRCPSLRKRRGIGGRIDLTSIREMLEAAGVEFIAETGGGAGVRLRKGQ